MLEGTANSEFLAAMADLYRRVDADIAARKPVCVASGRCCRFEEYGHRLYATHAELKYFYVRAVLPRLSGIVAGVEGMAAGPGRGDFPLPLYDGNGAFSPGCPWQVQGLCTAREGRPLGCRVYFCDAGSQIWQSGVYEQWHRQLVEMHQRFAIPYGYVEWRQGLKLLVGQHNAMTADVAAL